MVKNCVIISVSLSQEQANFLDDTNLSPSQLLQTKIEEQKKIFDAVNQEKEYLLRNMSDLRAILKDYSDYLEYSSKTEEFSQWRKDVVQKK